MHNILQTIFNNYFEYWISKIQYRLLGKKPTEKMFSSNLGFYDAFEC